MLKPESTSPSSNKLFKERERVLRSVLTDLTIVHPSCVNTFLVLVFTVTPSKTKIKTVTAKDRPESGKLKEVRFKCTPRLLQVSESFHLRDFRRDYLLRFRDLCMKKPCWCPSEWAQTRRP